MNDILPNITKYDMVINRRTIEMKSYKSWQEKLGFYYNYFGLKRENGTDCVTAQEIANDINKSKANVSHDLANLIKNPGRKNYGYNTTFIFKQLQKLMHLDRPCGIVIIGDCPSFIDLDLLKKRNFIIKDQRDTFSTDVLETDVQLLILTIPITKEEFDSIPDNICGIVNLSGTHYESTRPYYEIDLFTVLSNLWLDTLDLDAEHTLKE